MSAASSTSTYLSPEARATAHEMRFSPQYMTTQELAMHDGTQPDCMLLLALRCSAEPLSAAILDVASGADFYAPGGPYHFLAGRDCSRALSLTSFKPEHQHANMDEASDADWGVLDDWHKKLSAKYPTVGVLLPREKTALDAWRVVQEQQEPANSPLPGVDTTPLTADSAQNDTNDVDGWRIV